jgi:hypothetical protein
MGGSKSLYRIELNTNWQDDVITKVGRYWNGNAGAAAAALDEANNVFVMFNGMTGLPFVFWDLKTSSPTNNDQQVSDGSITGDIADYMSRPERSQGGMQYNPNDGKIYIWLTGGDVYKLTLPVGNPTPNTGWHIEKVTAIGVTSPSLLSAVTGDNQYTGVLGKWKYAPELGAFIALHKSVDGEVWVYKP